MIFIIKRYQKDMKDMGYNDYPKEKIGNENLVQVDLSN
jgi:hypothetical protein